MWQLYVPLENANRMNAIRQLGCLALTLTCLLLCGVADASIVVNGTRFVYMASDREITVTVRNKAKRPALMKAWIDAGKVSSEADSVKTPFLITPPLVRVDGDNEQVYRLRLIEKPENLPGDRESVFWINLLEVPPKAADTKKGGTENVIQLAFQYRLKMFYRPAGISGSPEEAAERLRWVIDNDEQGQRRISAINESPYHVSISKIALGINGKSILLKPEMVNPRASLAFDIPQSVSDSKLSISFQWIDDWGGLHERETTISR